MTLRRFLDVAYYLLIEEYQRIGSNIFEAIEKADRTLSGEAPSESLPAPSQNDSAIAALQTQMAGLRGAPKLGRA